MIRRLSIVALLLSAMLVSLRPAAADETPKQGTRILFVTFSGGFKHGSVNRKEGLAPAERAMTNLGISSNLFRVDCTQEPGKDLNQENLQNYNIVMFYTTGPKARWAAAYAPNADKASLPEGEKKFDEAFGYFLGDWLKQKGHGFIGAHSAADTLGDYEPYWDMIGGTFNGHPWGGGSTVTVAVHDQNHPVSKPWGPEFTIKDEIYRFKNWQPQKVHVLMSLDMSKTALKADYHVPISWVKNYGDGKAMHMSLGHNEAVWENPVYMQSMLGGVKWILGIEPGDATPNPELSSEQEAKAKADFAASGQEFPAGTKPPEKKPAEKKAK